MSESSRLPQFHVVGFAGHRRLEAPGMAARSLADALTGLRTEVPGEWIGISSAAAGSDLLFARCVLDLVMPWHALLPLPQAEFQKDFGPDEWRPVETLLAGAESVTVVGASTVREEAYLDCGIEVVNACVVLVALWDGEPARGRGGTAEVVAFARERGKPLVIIDPDTGESRRENFQNFASTDPELAFLNGLPEVPSSGVEQSEVRGIVERFMQKTDDAANKSAPQFRLLTAVTVLLHVAATTVATAGLAFDWHPTLLPWAKLLFVLGALSAALAIRHYRAQHNWVRCRLAAEIGRAALATWGMPRRAALFEDLDLPQVRHLVRSLHVMHRRGAPDKRANMDTFRQNYQASRIEDQLHYYRHRLEKAAPLLSRLRLGFAVSTILAIVCMTAYALHSSLRLPPAPPLVEELIFQFLPIVLPAIAAAFIALMSINDLHRRVARYREMCKLLESACTQIRAMHTWHSVEQLVRHTERALLQEVLEWHTLMSHLEPH
jgi:hypothetical protein